MGREIIDNIKALYKSFSSPVSEEEKISLITNFKLSIGLEINEKLGDYYACNLDNNKENGVVYTPDEISRYIVENTIKPEVIISNPFLKILDPACGSGNIIISCFLHLVNIYKENLELINQKNKLKIHEDMIAKHILDHNIFGNDIDETALYILQLDLFSLGRYINRDNFQTADFLTKNISIKYDIILGNPPYVGHKSIDKDYGDLIRKQYGHVFRDKGDLSYCFFSKAIECTTDCGKITFITSRYFMESSSGMQLRGLLSGSASVEKIIDFYGIRPFKGIGIDPAILFITKESREKIEVIKPVFNEMTLKSLLIKDTHIFNNISFKRFYINKKDLDERNWMLIDGVTKEIVNKIEKKSNNRLQDICNSHQGIITGCDRAFIVTEDIICEKKLERDIIKPWIKSSHINKPSQARAKEFIIYSNLIDDVKRYPNAIEHIACHKDKLMNRRECRKGVRKWFELQWGRKAELFEGKKIIFPYKSSNNRFALDKSSYYSADIYALTINESMNIGYEYLLFILNSSLYEFYFKTFAKKLGGSLYEYYPNNLMKLKLPDLDQVSSFTEEFLYDYFELTDSEINTVMEKGNQ